MNIPNLERRTKELVRDWAKGWVSFQPSENALQCLEAGVTEALRQTREEALVEKTHFVTQDQKQKVIDRIDFIQKEARAKALEEAAKVIEKCDNHFSAKQLAESIRALASGTGEEK